MDSSGILVCKENIQPLRHGRDASKLCAGLQALTDTDAEKALESQRQEYEILLRDDTLEDPLGVWFEYVYWLVQSFPSHAHKSNVIVILRKCINKFKKDERYMNDERFVKLCLKYATMSDNTSDTIKQIYGNGIGVKCAILYIAWGEQYALANSFKLAAKVYEKGIKGLAQPIEALKSAQKKFEAFLVKRMLDSGEIFQANTELYETGPVRQAYSKIKTLSVRGKEVVPSVRVGENVAAAGKYKIPATQPQKTGQAFAIYQDAEEDGLIGEAAAPRSQKFKSQSALNKENAKKAGVWTNANKKDAVFSLPPVSLPFAVHEDEGAIQPVVSHNAPMTSALKPKQFDEFNDDFATTALFISEPYDPKVRPMYRKEQVYAGGLEFQFEELRAMRYRKKRPLVAETPVPARTVDEQLTTPMTVADRLKPLVKDDAMTTPMPGKQRGLSKRCDPPLTTPLQRTSSKSLDPAQPSGTKSKTISESTRKSGLKVRTCEEARSARRKIAIGGISEDTEKKTHSARKSNFGGVVRRALDLDGGNSGAKPDLPSDSFINQTIHTKEAVNEMQELWFARPAPPPASAAPPVKPSAPLSEFQFYVDESCIEKIPAEADFTPAALPSSSSRPQHLPLAPFVCHQDDDDDKENVAPVDYAGGIGRSQRPVTGVLTPSDNVPYEPIPEEEEDEDEYECEADLPGNTTGITETWNFTQAFAFPKITQSSTPNVRRSLYRPTPAEHVNSFPDEDAEDVEAPMDLKVTAQILPPQPQRVLSEEVPTESRKSLFRAPVVEQRTMGEKNLSIIVETSREYKSSSSGSGTSHYCSKLMPFTPGTSRMDAKRLSSYSHADDGRKTPFACKTQSTYGYEASAEVSCTNTKNMPDEMIPSNENEPLGLTSSKNDEVIHKGMKRMTISKSFTLSQIPGLRDLTDIDPFDTKLIDNLLEAMSFPTANHESGCHFMYSKLPAIKLQSRVTLGTDTLEIRKVLGEGAYAKVFRCHSLATSEDKVVKYQKPACPWEFYIAREIHARLSKSHMVSYFMKIHEGFFFDNASLLVSSPVEYGDMLSAINLYKINQGKPMTDYLALYFSVQVLEIIQVLHSLRIIHGDVKPDNFLLKKLNGRLCLELIDFGRSIDMTQFPESTTFTRVVTTDAFTCIEMQTGAPWTHQIDWYGAAGCVHCLLFGDYMKVTQKAGQWDIVKNIPRYLAKSGWKELFNALLNIPSCTEMPDISRLRASMAEKLDAYGNHPDLVKLTNFLDKH